MDNNFKVIMKRLCTKPISTLFKKLILYNHHGKLLIMIL